MRVINVKKGQDLLDVALQEYGSAEGVIKLIEDNLTLTLESDLLVGQELTIIQEPDKAEIVNYYSKFNHIVTSGTDS